MREESSLPLEAWASALSDARRVRGLDLTQTARELLLSPAQLRGIESASLNAFHGEGYYLRAVEKYAKFLQVELVPPLEGLEQTDSQIALKRFNKGATVVTLAKREMSMGTTLEEPTGRRTRLGLWLVLTLGVVVAVGAYLAIDEGWPNNSNESESVAAIVQEPRSQPSKPVIPAAPTPSSAGQQMVVTIEPVRPVNAPPLAGEPNVVSAPTAGLGDPNSGSVNPVPEKQSTQVPSPITTSVATPPTPPDIIEVTFTQDCWVEVRFNDNRVEQKIYTPGERLELRASEIRSLVFGNARAVNAQRAKVAWSVMPFTAPGGNVARIPQASLQKP